MSVEFRVPARNRRNKFTDRVSINDAVTYEFDLTAWQEDNNTITSATWTVESGQASVSGQAISSGVLSALVSFTEQGKSLISVLADTGTEKKQLWLEVHAEDYEYPTDDYGGALS